MTLSSTTAKVSYTGDGSTTVFSFPYYFQDDTDLTVIVTTAAGVESVKTLTTHYTVSGADSSSGGSVTMLSAPGSGTTVTILRDPAKTQGLDLETNGSFPAATTEEALDKLTMIAQALGESVGRAPKLRKSTPSSTPTFPEPTALGYLRWNSGATDLECVELSVESLTDHLNDATDAHDASAISVADAGGLLAAANVEAALAEIQTGLNNALIVTGSKGSPSNIVAGTGVTITSGMYQETKFIQGSGGAVDVSANPQVAAGTIVGQRLLLIGCSNTNTVLLEHGTGLDLNGSITMGLNWMLELVWDGTNWLEKSRTERS